MFTLFLSFDPATCNLRAVYICVTKAQQSIDRHSPNIYVVCWAKKYSIMRTLLYTIVYHLYRHLSVNSTLIYFIRETPFNLMFNICRSNLSFCLHSGTLCSMLLNLSIYFMLCHHYLSLMIVYECILNTSFLATSNQVVYTSHSACLDLFSFFIT